ncbi:MAG TPA: CHAT domain-containing tetratricopeptide repeat protein [Chloroflexia bacterium]|nr:CHAT domain-containing tetratricopeptide repeat protein [Chloroflexia bacterium]
MSIANQLVESSNAEEWRDFLLQNFAQLELDEYNEDVTSHVTYRVKLHANQLLNSNQRQKALELADLLLYLSENLPVTLPRTRHLARARALMIRANYLRTNGEVEQAAAYYREAQQLCQENNNSLEAIRCQMTLVDALARLGRAGEAFELAELIIGQAEMLGDMTLLVGVLSNVSAFYYNQNEYHKAIELYNRQYQLLQESDETEPVELLDCYLGLAWNYLRLNNYQEVISWAEKARQVAQRIDQALSEARAQQLIANALYLQGHFTRALRTWESAQRLFQEQNSPQESHHVSQWRCECLVQLNRLEEALELCEEQITEARSNHWADDLADRIHWRANLQARMGLSEEALASYDEATALYQHLEKPNFLANMRLDQAELLVELEEFERASEILSQAIPEFERQGTYQGLARVWLMQARIALAKVALEQARRLVDKIMLVARESDLPSLLYRTWYLTGEIAEASGEPHLALEAYREAATQVERLRGAVTLELRGDFLKDKMQVYEAVVSSALEEGNLELAYDYIERSKSRALTELLANQVDLQVKARSPEDEALIEQLNGLRGEHTYYYNLLNQPLAEVEAPPSAEVQEELRVREKKIEQLLRALQVRNSAYAEDFSLIEVQSELPQACLDPDTLLVEYYIVREEVLALAISRDEIKLYRDLSSLSKLERAINNLALVLQHMEPQIAPRFLASTQAQLYNLYRQILEPLAGLAARYSRLIIVPHGPLHHLPFHALWNRQSERYLVQDFEISYLPSASQLKFYRQRAEELRKAANSASHLVLGYSSKGNLPYVEQEVNEISALLGQNALVYLEEEACRSVLENLSGNYRAIHLATHGHFRSDAPLFSFVELADGTLLTADIFNLKLNSQLVTLSACESGLNVITGGDELTGLSRACLYAGAASLLLSLWRVEDYSTTCLMKEFYHRLNQPNTTRAGALRSAQLALLSGDLAPDRTDYYKHPYFWAPFFLIGEDGAL